MIARQTVARAACGRAHALRSLLVTICCLLTLAACEQTTVAPRETVTLSIAGSTAMQPVLLELTDVFARQQPHVVFNLRGGGSELGETLVRNGRVDLAASTLLPGEADDDDVRRTPIGLDGVVIIVNVRRAVETLRVEQVRNLFTGDVLEWSTVENEAAGEEASASENPEPNAEQAALSQGDDEILLVSREDGSGSRAVFEERIMQGAPVSLTAVVMPTSADVVEYVASQPNAIGYVSPAYLQCPATDAEAQPVERVYVVALDGLLPNDQTLRDQSYPLTQPLYLLTRSEIADSESSETVRQFVDFVLSPRGQAIVGRYHTRLR